MARWTVKITLNALDISAQVTGVIRVEAEESTASIARFTFRPAGVINPTDWIGSPVTIDYVDDPDGAPVVERLFSGVVNLPTFNPRNKRVQMDCTDNLQGHFEAMDPAAILTAIAGGKYSVVAFGERQDGWQQALDVLSTVPKSYDLGRDGVTGNLTAWAAKLAPDFSYTVSSILDNSVSLELARLRDLVNRVTLKYQYRYTRLHHREHTFAWSWNKAFCTYYLDSHELPNREMCQSAASGAGWKLQGGLRFDSLPESGTYDCNGPVVWVITDEKLDQLVISAGWTAVRRWSQTLTEDYTLTVDDPGSQALYGLAQAEDGMGDSHEYDDSTWDSSEDTATPAWPVNAIGDYTEDQLDRAVTDNNLETLLQIAATNIQSSHRQNFLTARVLINPVLDRTHSVSMDTGGISGTGKVAQYIHLLDTATGSATTDIRIAISLSGGGVIDPLSAPPAPDSQPVHAAPPSSTSLPMRIGNDDTAPNYDPDWTGFTGDYAVAHGTPTLEQQYPRRFRVVTPAIEAESRDEVQAVASLGLAYVVNSPAEPLVIDAG